MTKNDEFWHSSVPTLPDISCPTLPGIYSKLSKQCRNIIDQCVKQHPACEGYYIITTATSLTRDHRNNTAEDWINCITCLQKIIKEILWNTVKTKYLNDFFEHKKHRQRKKIIPIRNQKQPVSTQSYYSLNQYSQRITKKKKHAQQINVCLGVCENLLIELQNTIRDSGIFNNEQLAQITHIMATEDAYDLSTEEMVSSSLSSPEM